MGKFTKQPWRRRGAATSVFCKGCIEKLAPQVGLEPTTLRLTAECSTIELLRSNGVPSLKQTLGSSVKSVNIPNIPGARLLMGWFDTGSGFSLYLTASSRVRQLADEFAHAQPMRRGSLSERTIR